MREQVEMLEHHADLEANFVDLFQIIRQFNTIDNDFAFLVFFQTVDATDHS